MHSSQMARRKAKIKKIEKILEIVEEEVEEDSEEGVGVGEVVNLATEAAVSNTNSVKDSKNRNSPRNFNQHDHSIHFLHHIF